MARQLEIKFAIPTLHCVLGPVNRLIHYVEEHSTVGGEFIKSLGITRDPFNNKDYNGNYCNKILENLDRLEETIEKEYIPFVTTLRALKGVKDSCFGPKLHENLKENIQNFEKAWFDIYIEFDIYFSNKCHVIIEHIPQVIERTGKSLYLSSEQVVEATHAKFAVFWERYKVNNLEKETHGTNLRSCVVEFNTRNL